jgi:hypothetical protein
VKIHPQSLLLDSCCLSVAETRLANLAADAAGIEDAAAAADDDDNENFVVVAAAAAPDPPKVPPK